MLIIRDMKESDRQQVLPMVIDFYHSDAVDHLVPDTIPKKVFDDVIKGNGMIRGVVLLEEDMVVGFAYLSWYYACEVAGMNLMIEEIYLKAECRGKGYGNEFFQWVFKEYPEAVRFRIEVTDVNGSAIRFYKSLGFEFLGYRQMIKGNSTLASKIITGQKSF